MTPRVMVKCSYEIREKSSFDENDDDDDDVCLFLNFEE
jgi:hypothetical protein